MLFKDFNHESGNGATARTWPQIPQIKPAPSAEQNLKATVRDGITTQLRNAYREILMR
jgi:hypothetical protein